MVLLQILWCCRQSKHSVYASAAIALIASFASLFAGIVTLVHWKDKTFCDMLVLGSGKLSNDDTFFLDFCPQNLSGTISIVCGSLWLAVAFCMFYFAKSKRHAKWEEHHSETAANAETTKEKDPVAVEMGAVPPASAFVGKMDITDWSSSVEYEGITAEEQNIWTIIEEE